MDKRRMNTNSSQTLPKTRKGTQSILWGKCHPDTKIEERHHKNRKLTDQSFLHQCGCKNPWQNTIKLNVATHKKNYIL